jgi:hypothetical protein
MRIRKAGNRKMERGLVHNAVSYFGGLIIILSLLLILSLILLGLVEPKPSPYLGIFTFMIFPAFLILGVLVFFYGVAWERRRRRLRGIQEALPLPVLDLNNQRQRRRLAFVSVGGCFLAVLLSFLAYNAYLFTDSVTFCGRVCHRVMEPEYTAYLSGPHARVPCVDCHVGSGVSWYLRSKVAGVPQVFATIFHTYPTPIPVPVEHLRPARETCEECHWPQKFYGAQLVQLPYFRNTEKNTAEQISFLVKTGGGNPKLGENGGIHWHMIINNQVIFRSTDRQLQHIPWIKLTHPDGTEVIYRDKNVHISEKELEKLPRHLMDCMHCHNRPAHLFLPPETAVNRNLNNGNISPALPWIKKLAVEALVKKYPDRQRAQVEIRQSFERYYGKNFPDLLKKDKEPVDGAIVAVSAIYDRSVFPHMKVNWATYPNDIGHRSWPGCFRCHDGQHVNQQGKVLTHSCAACHTVPERGPLMPLGATPPTSKEYWHPWLLKGKHTNLLCYVCHEQGYPSTRGCAECHKIDTTRPMMAMGCNTCHLKQGEVRPLVNCQSCHRQLRGLHRKGGHPGVACTTCHAAHAWKITTRDICLICHRNKENHYAATFCGKCHRFATG